ncbi:hypothetical protein [Legionella fallonii]|uniref:Uncharacterized protein n=1 Tax=Legionella fallonii LLAP-10 TaxID=1212491 RepID=A0A098G6V7_9GAMM|nr:hypothetical protein [Legionella fallonii]CEG57225.1 protein of unknown function [Legionella fallonii LLAP-10]
MPDKIFDIVSSTIDQDQFNVATQWAKTFLHTPDNDLASNMTQLLMACVAKGDFKTRPYMSTSSELRAPSDQLTIADYLSHASRIIIDYNFLSEVNTQELLSYFPEASETNGVFSRSATHNVNQVKEKVVEGKGVLIGVTGQLPSIIKTPRDFGLNIAMGGTGQDNFYGKKISANGFSGHFYYHRNTEHKLLLAGLEQSAPAASALELFTGGRKYSEDEQQGHDQFGQGHSLTGASDTYTAAGSLYFSNPLYQAKLLLEKGVFPPDKYGAMQVTITDENWPFIKDFFKSLKTTVQEGNQEAVVQQLLERPVTAENTKGECSSYVAIDFGAYLKQVYKVLVDGSELPENEKLTFATMQEELLVLIKKLQIGNVKALPEFETLISKIMAVENIPEAYKIALIRINDLFKLQLMIDPELKNTQVNRQYQFGDMTWGMLGRVNQMVNGAQIQEEGVEDLKEYEFGDITWGLLNRISQRVNDKEEYQFGDVTLGLLTNINQRVTGKQDYQFGDITWGLLGWGQPANQPSTQNQESDPTQSSGYRFGDLTRYMLSGSDKAPVQVPSEKAPQPTTEYKFGDYTRSLIWGSNKSTVIQQPKDESKKDDTDSFEPSSQI